LPDGTIKPPPGEEYYQQEVVEAEGDDIEYEDPLDPTNT
jgi:hypothetical protein